MFKKKRKVVIETSPLQSYAVGNVKENKFALLKVALFFCFFIGVIYFLPELYTVYQKYISGSYTPDTPDVNNQVNNNTTNNTTQNNTVNETKYYFKDDNIIEVSNLKFSVIKLTDKAVSFNVENLSKTNINLEDSNVFFELYDENNEVIKRIGLYGTLQSEGKKTVDFNFEGNESYYEIKKIAEEDFTYIDLGIDDNNISVLTCKNDGEKIVYTFTNDKLTKINHTDEVDKNIDVYDQKYIKYNDFYTKNRNTTGVSTTFTVTDKKLSYSMIVDYNKVTSTIDGYLYFAKNTNPRIVNFKVESWEYECS